MAARAVVAAAVAAVAAAAETVVVPQAQLTRATYPEWVHSHWIWPASGVPPGGNPKTQEGILNHHAQFTEYDLTVGVTNVDSGWETQYNSFNVDLVKYPNATDMVNILHAQGSRVTFWITSFINPESETYQEAFDNNYFLNDGKLVDWWHGTGSLFDFTNPEGLNWWKAQMDKALALGIDGWKLDGSDPFIWFLFERAYGYGGRVRKADYSDQFYRTFMDHSRVREPEAAILSRPMDAMNPGSKRFPRLFFTPQDICFAGWVGDQDATFYGLQAALLHMFASANFNYVNVGSDVGGFGTDGSTLGRTKEILLRWTQASSMNPLFENGGNGEHRPWIFDTETLEIYRFYLWLHEELRPFYYSRGNDAFDQGIAIMEHQGKCFWRPGEAFPYPDPCTYEWTLARDIFTSPVVTNLTSRVITFPYAGEQWVDWFNEALVYNGTEVITREPTLAEAPIFRRVGSVIPLQVARRYTGNDFGMPLERMMEVTAAVLAGEPSLARTRKVAAPVLAPAPVRVVLWTHPLLLDADAVATPVVHSSIRDDYGPGLTVDVSLAPRSEGAPRTLRMALSAHPRPTAVVITGWTAAAAATTAALVEDADGPFLDGLVAVTATHAMKQQAIPTATALAELGAGTAFAVDEARQRLIVWLDAATLARGAVLELVAA